MTNTSDDLRRAAMDTERRLAAIEEWLFSHAADGRRGDGDRIASGGPVPLTYGQARGLLDALADLREALSHA